MYLLTFQFLLKNALLDEHLTHFKDKEYSDCIKDHTGIKYEVGVDIKTGSSDVELAKFCIEHCCDFITADKKAYDEIFTIEEVKSIEIIRILKNEPTINRPVYSLSFKTGYL